MAGFRNIAGSGHGSPYLDALVWGGQVWDTTNEPIRVWAGGGWDDNNDADYWEALDYHGPSPLMEDSDYRGSWDDESIQTVVEIMALYSSVANISFEPASSIGQANIVWWWAQLPDRVTGMHETPDGFPTHQRWGMFNVGMPEYMAEKGFGGGGRATMIHEIGHSLGLAHPHDGGGREDKTTFPGVGQVPDLGDFNFNQTIFTQMSYNPGINTLPANYSYGGQGGLGAFDIAAIQLIYGANMSTATGNDTYTVPTMNERGTGWMGIWDAGGTDTISAAGSTAGAVIDLRAATLAPNDPGAGGYISHQTGIAGGFTIARGVVIENALGSAHSDVLIGNGTANTLNGGAGDDTYYVDTPDDVVIDASGTDTVYATFNFSSSAIENIFVNGVQVKSGGLPVGGGTPGSGGTPIGGGAPGSGGTPSQGGTPSGGEGYQVLRGGSARDVLTGGGHEDRFYGGLGKDVLTGGAGHDIFVFNTKLSRSNVDTVTDYSVAEDSIWLDNKVMKKLGKGSEATPQALNRTIFALDRPKDGNDYLVYVRKTGVLYYDEDGAGAKAAVQIAKLPKKLAGFSAGEFFVI